MARIIESPGVQITETDLSLRTQLPVGTNIAAFGFADQGPTDELLHISTISEFEEIYGFPTNAAERYFYHSVKQILQPGTGNLIVSRLPYGSGSGEGYGSDYTALAYPVFPVPNAGNGYIAGGGGTLFENASAYYIGEPTHVKLTEDQYQNIIQGNFTWNSLGGASATNITPSTLGDAGIIVLNTAKTTINDKYEGLYIAFADNTNINPASNFESVTGVKTVDASNTFSLIANSRLAFTLNAPFSGTPGSTSEIIENIPGFNFETSAFNDSLIFTIFKLRSSIYNQDTFTLDQVLQESYVGSLYSQRKVQNTNGGLPVTFYLEDVVNENSPTVKVFVNPNISRKGSWVNPDGTVAKVSRVLTNSQPPAGYNRTAFNAQNASTYMSNADNLYALGLYVPHVGMSQVKDIGSVPNKLSRALRLLENPATTPLDVVIDAGLSTIWTAATNVANNALPAGVGDYTYDDSYYMDTSVLLSQTDQPVGGIQDDWEIIFNQFNTLVQDQRKDSIFISDPLRNIFVNGPDTKVLSLKDRSFSQHIYWPLRNLYQSTGGTSYSVAYANWIKTYDERGDIRFWAPISGFIAAAIARNDANSFPWNAVAGLSQGRLSNVLDIAINPNQKQRDLLYRISQNPVILFPQEGYIIWGQKTLYTKPSAFDRLNVRRLFLTLEKATQRVLDYFVFQPNVTTTRVRVVNALTPIYEQAKATGGLVDYLIIADESVNTAQVVDDQSLKVAIYIKPTRTAEFILAEFVATRSDTNFSEIIG